MKKNIPVLIAALILAPRGAQAAPVEEFPRETHRTEYRFDENHSQRRAKAMDAEFSCIREQRGRQGTLEWSDVCVAGDPVPAHKLVTKKDLVNMALDEVATKREVRPARSPTRRESRILPPPARSSSPLASVASGRPKEKESDEVEADYYAPAEKPAKKRHEESSWQVPPEPIVKKDQVEIGTEISHISYKEPIFNLEEKGVMYGVYASYAHRLDEKKTDTAVINMVKLDGKFSTGSLDYKSDGSGTLENIPDYIIELRGVLGYDFTPVPQSVITPYAGLGFRYLKDGGGGMSSSTGALAYDRAARYYYLPMGVEFQNQLSSDWLIAMTGEFDIFLYGRQSSYLSDTSVLEPDLQNDQHRGYGLRGSFQLVKKGEGMNIAIAPFIRYWRVRNSELTGAVGPSGVVEYGDEPNNNSTEFGVKLSVQY